MPEQLYRILYAAYGPQRWWPAKSAFEMMTGAILVQNTAWTQASKAVLRLETEGALTPAGIRHCPEEQLWEWIRPAGYFRVKAKRLLALAEFLAGFADDPEQLFRLETQPLRTALLGVHGIGPESADSIVCYGGARPVFVVDAYTRRIFERLGWTPATASYERLQRLVQERMTGDARQFGELHALIVRHAKNHCRSKPFCSGCPLTFCPMGTGGRR